jgi:hypothetical protein
MPKGHLIPTPITNVNGVATTVYRSPDKAAVKTASMPPVKLSPLESPNDPVDALMAQFGSDEERLEDGLRRATPEQLHDVERALAVARGRESRRLSVSRNSDSLCHLVADGAYTAVAKIAEYGDDAPNSASLKAFGHTEVAKDIVDFVDRIIPSPGREQSIEVFARTPSLHLDAVRHAVEAAALMDGNKEASDRVESSMYGVVNMTSLNEYGYVEDFVRHWKGIPKGMNANGFRTVMVALGYLTPPSGGKYVEIAAHLKACHASSFDEDQGWKRLLAGQAYLQNRGLVNGVEMYPDHVDAILQWHREGRGTDFDSDAFRDYVAGGTLREGIL